MESQNSPLSTQGPPGPDSCSQKPDVATLCKHIQVYNKQLPTSLLFPVPFLLCCLPLFLPLILFIDEFKSSLKLTQMCHHCGTLLIRVPSC